MKIVISPDAERQLYDVSARLGSVGAAQGAAFFRAFDEQMERLLEFPRMCPVVHGRDVRRALLRRWQCAIFYRVAGQEIVILGVFPPGIDPKRLRL